MVLVKSQEDLQKYTKMVFSMLQEYPFAMTVEQVQEVLNIKEKQAYKRIHSGELPTMRIGKVYRILKPELIKYIVSRSLDLSQIEGGADAIDYSDMLMKCCAA